MTIKEAILKTLEDKSSLCNSTEVCNHIIANNYADFTGKTPTSTVSSIMGEFIRNGDTRIKRINQPNGIYLYYLAKYEQDIETTLLALEDNNDAGTTICAEPAITKIKKTYEERDLHPILATYLKSTDVYCKTIYHEQSTYGKDSNQTWTHPDMVGIQFLKLHTKTTQNFLRSVNRVDSFKMSSYELKREVNTDNELKKAFFQAFSNSSWANYGYLVAFEFSDSLREEMSRLNQSFGIGIIELDANPFQSKVLFPARYKDLDFKTIDKLCRINKEFDRFIEQTEKLLTAQERYYTSTEKELDEFCDVALGSDSKIEEYCKLKNIPME